MGGAGFRRQYVHAIDIVPTVLEAVGIEPPEEIRGVAQRPIEGTSFFASIADPASPDDAHTQYYEMFGCRALYHEGWKAVTYHPIMQIEPGIDADRVGALPRRGRTRRSATTWRQQEPERLRADGRALVGRSRPVPGAAPRPPALCPCSCTERP